MFDLDLDLDVLVLTLLITEALSVYLMLINLGSMNYIYQAQATWDGTFNNLVSPKGRVFERHFWPQR